MKKPVFLFFAAFALVATVRGEENPLAGISFDVPQTWPCKELTGPGHRAIWVQGESWSGMPTRVFAYVVLPEGASAARKAPGVVLAHGGLGTAYLSWAETWAKHGYAAIVPDTCGALPIRITGEKRAELRWARTGVGGPHGWGRYDLADEAPGDQWPYHAVGALVRCHSYLRSLPEVDAEKTGLVGISWGGFLTMLASAHDTRFKFAMPVYTCAFFDELEKYGPNRDRASFPRHLLDRWGELFDPKHYVPKMTMPAMWFASTNDSYFPFDLLQRTAALLPRRAQLAVRVRMAHSHGPHGENMPELFRFADSVVRGGRPLPELDCPTLENGEVSVRFDAKGQALKRFDLIWCTNAPPVAASAWQVKACPAPSGEVFTAQLPAGATRVYVNAVLEGDSGEEVYPETLVSSPTLSCGESLLEAKIAAKHKILVSDQWGGGHRIIFDFNGRKGWVIEPKEPADGRPWVWTMQWMGAFLERTGAPSIVRAGGYHVHLAAFDTRANDEGLKALAEFQDYLTGELGLAPKARLIGMSWGGFYSVRYASAYPEKVASIYLDAPLLNAYTLPNLTVTNAVEDAKVIGPWAASRPSGDIADDPRQAVNLAEKVAAAKIPILLLYGGADQTVDPARNCELFVPRFKAAGGRIEVKRRPYYGHHPHGVDITDVSQIADFFGLPAKAASAASDEIVEGTHGYTPEGYVEPREPAVREALERFRDRKLGLMMHWGPYCQLGIVRAESWPLSDDDAGWARKGWTGGEDNEAFKRMYQDLPKTFAPSMFDPAAWADMARRDGFKYVIFTTKHHDGFCMFDSKYSDYRITNPAFPFAKDPRADIAKGVFDAFRAKGLSAVCYFSKPDWHHNDFWESAGLGVRTSRWPTYAVKSHPEKWENFRKYVRNQILELVDNYGPFDALWLDGGTCKPKWHLDVDIPGIVDEARRRNPGLISVDRTTGGPYENVITPEQTIPPVPILAPWESCITLGKGWAYRPNDDYKGAREIIHLLIDVVAKGGNLALNVGPSPDGTFAPEAVDRLDRLGAWLARNGDAIYATRPARPWRSGDWAFTGSKDGRSLYAIRLYPEGGRLGPGEMIPVDDGLKVTKVVHLGTGREIPFAHPVGGIRLELPADFQPDAYADAFRIQVK